MRNSLRELGEFKRKHRNYVQLPSLAITTEIVADLNVSFVVAIDCRRKQWGIFPINRVVLFFKFTITNFIVMRDTCKL